MFQWNLRSPAKENIKQVLDINYFYVKVKCKVEALFSYQLTINLGCLTGK